MTYDEIRARLDAATPGPLTPEHVASDEDGWLYASITHAHRLRDGSVCSYHVATIDSGEDDAEFIAHAPEDMRRLLNAVEGVLGQHQLVESPDGDGGFLWECSECGYEPDGQEPCPTVKAITSALEAS